MGEKRPVELVEQGFFFFSFSFSALSKRKKGKQKKKKNEKSTLTHKSLKKYVNLKSYSTMY